MPGTLLPPEMVTELTEMAGRILQEVLQLDDRDVEFGNGKPAWAYIVEHSIDATVAGVLVGRRLLPEDQLQPLATGLFLQDIGKLALPERIVQKPGALDPGEWELMMQHPLLGLSSSATTRSPRPRSRWFALTTSGGTARATPTA